MDIYLRKRPAKWAISGSCFKARRIGSAENQTAKIGYIYVSAIRKKMEGKYRLLT
jgi:hypothetical protein